MAGVAAVVAADHAKPQHHGAAGNVLPEHHQAQQPNLVQPTGEVLVASDDAQATEHTQTSDEAQGTDPIQVWAATLREAGRIRDERLKQLQSLKDSSLLDDKEYQAECQIVLDAFLARKNQAKCIKDAAMEMIAAQQVCRLVSCPPAK
jgi:hypothetical protein